MADALSFVDDVATVVPIQAIQNELTPSLASDFTKRYFDVVNDSLKDIMKSEVGVGTSTDEVEMYIVEADKSMAIYIDFPNFIEMLDMPSFMFYEEVFIRYSDAMAYCVDVGYKKIMIPLNWAWMHGADPHLIVEIARTVALIHRHSFNEIIFNCIDPDMLHFLSLKL